LIFCQYIFIVNATPNRAAAIICQTILPKPGSRYADTGCGITKIRKNTKKISFGFKKITPYISYI
jgi:hypothetical protein